MQENIREALNALVASGDLSLIERIELPAREERRLPIPEAFRRGAPGNFLATVETTGTGLWRHQSLALEHVAAGKNVVVSTGTASGKSLVFQAASLRLLTEEPEARIVVFYPLKALAADQMRSWQRAIEKTDLAEGTVGMIHGGVRPDERDRIIDRARIVLMTPDVCHAWFMRQVSTKSIRRFLSHLQLVVLDEAHVLEAVFGSNVAYLLRRMQAARAIVVRNRKTLPLQIIAASATIANPGEHLTLLTGVPFVLVDESDNGSSTYERSLLHISMPDVSYNVVSDLLSSLLKTSNQEGSFIAFADSRQGVEKIVDPLAHDGVRPYRAGYEEKDRADIERALQNGELLGVVSTSALELGINIPHFSTGLNVDVPNSRKAFRQRVGRIGRSQPGVFAVLAAPQAFQRHGSTFRDYWQGSVEPSHLYLENRFMQFMHARCLSDELDALGVRKTRPPASVTWPDGFSKVYDFARPGGARPREFDPIAQIGGNDPHLNYPLRNVGEISFKLQGVQSMPGGDGIGSITLPQAIREAYPGGVYLHLARRYRVVEWKNSAFERFIRLAKTNATYSRPLLQTYVNAAVEDRGIIAGHYKKCEAGFLYECELQVTERVIGYSQGNTNHLYKDLRQENPRLTAKTRDFRTTGVVLRIAQPWVREQGLKVQIATALKDAVLREYSVSPQDIDCVATHIALVRSGMREAISDAIVIYDGTYGSLRLTEPIFTDLGRLIERFEHAAALTEDDRDAPLPKDVVRNLREWWEELSDTAIPSVDGNVIPDGFIQVLKRGSRVSMHDAKGVLHDIEILAPEMFDPQSLGYQGPITLVYQYRPDGSPSGNNSMKVASDKVVPTGGEWSWVLWSPTTGEFKEESEADDQT